MSWEYRGIEGAGKAPGPLGMSSGICLVIAGARCVWEDIARFWTLMGEDFTNDREAEPPWTTIAVNDIATHYRPKLEHMASLHAGQLGPSVLLRVENNCHLSQPLTHTQKYKPDLPIPVLYNWELRGYVGGTSAGFAVAIALAMGHNKVVLAGVPLNGGGHYFDPPFATLAQFDTRTQDIQWAMFRKHFEDRVKSMSGKTQSILGEVTKQWLLM